MKAEIGEYGDLVVISETKTERYALDKWFEENIDGCSLNFKEKHKIIYHDYEEYKITLFKRIWFKIRLYFCR